MNTLTLEGWCKPQGHTRSSPIQSIHFRVSDEAHLRLEEAERALQKYQHPEMFVDVELDEMELATSSDCGPLADCQLRVYLDSTDRGQFHLVGHRAVDRSLVYSNAVMIDQLG